jgi:hypothetical protein
MRADPSEIAPVAAMEIQFRTLLNLALDWDKMSDSHTNDSPPSNKEGALYPPNRKAGRAHSSLARCG